MHGGCHSGEHDIDNNVLLTKDAAFTFNNKAIQNARHLLSDVWKSWNLSRKTLRLLAAMYKCKFLRKRISMVPENDIARVTGSADLDRWRADWLSS